jgi:DnaJ family protein C protein 2
VCHPAATTSKLLPAGPAFQAHARRVLNQRSFEEDDRVQHEEFLANGGGAGEVEDDADEGLGDEQEDKQLLLNDPKLWKVSPEWVRDEDEN